MEPSFFSFFFSPSESEIKISGNIFRNCERRLKKMVSNFFFLGEIGMEKFLGLESEIEIKIDDIFNS